MPEDREYRILDEGNAIVARLRERYPKAFWPVVPEQVLVLAVTNKPRPFTMKRLAKITKVDAAHRTVIRALGRRDVRYLVELYLTDWTTWNGPQAVDTGARDRPHRRGGGEGPRQARR